MAGRKVNPRGDGFSFGGSGGSSVAPIMSDVAAAMLSKLRASEEEQRVVELLDIFHIRPDLAQPRRIMPLEVRTRINDDPQAALKAWIEMVEQETDRPFDLHQYLNLADFERPEKPDELEAELIALVSLARTIKNEGLDEPISVYSVDRDWWKLEHGERRWLAFHLLYGATGDDKYLQIPAFVVERFNVWRQAAENGARQNLNAIGNARQLARLIMALYAEQGYAFQPYEDMVQPGCADRCFYAQVADGERFRIPRGQGEMIMAYMGVKDSSQLRQYRMLLDIPDKLWVTADELNMPQAVIRANAKGKPGGSHTVKKLTVSIPSAIAPKWQAMKERMPDVKDADLLDRLIDFYLSHQEAE